MNKIPDLSHKPVAVFGLARSGLSVIRALTKADTKVIAWDDNEAARIEAKRIKPCVEPLTLNNLAQCAFLVLAPGVPLRFPKPHAVVLAAQQAGIEIICDIELFHRMGLGGRTIGITGTNGKSTTTALIYQILKSSGKKAVMGGNIGLPVFDLPSADMTVLELSSYQIDLCPTFRPDIAVLLNITPDHLDRHGNMENYAAIKERIFEGPGTAVISTDGEECRAILNRVQSAGNRTVIPFSIEDDFLSGVMEGAVLKGQHNYQNALAAFHVCRTAGISDEVIKSGLQSFQGLPHRQFTVRKINGISYVNDSKATNAESAARALMSYDDIYWIVGGMPKEGGLTGLESLAGRVRKAFVIGEAADSFAGWMEDNNIEYHKSGILNTAVSEAHRAAQRSEKGVVLLSPACASFDQFSSYEERGDVFTSLVNQLEESAAA